MDCTSLNRPTLSSNKAPVLAGCATNRATSLHCNFMSTQSKPSSPLKAVRGTRDLLPPETALWNHVESVARAVFARYGFGEIRTPIFEDTQLFARGVGEETDIVSKEMYTWEDRARAQSEKAQSLTLRPENTAGVVRAYIEHKLGDSGNLQKLYYLGAQFRRERPQRGRYRQFWQIGAEVLGPPSSGSESPIRDAEVLEMLATLLDQLGIHGWQLQLNSVGSAEDRQRYNAALREALAPIKHQLCEDNQRRAETNPLRVLDSKDPNDQALIDTLPKIADYLDDASRTHFAASPLCARRLRHPLHRQPPPRPRPRLLHPHHL
jgi:histidyl-tRNA synthetase